MGGDFDKENYIAYADPLAPLLIDRQSHLPPSLEQQHPISVHPRPARHAHYA